MSAASSSFAKTILYATLIISVINHLFLLYILIRKVSMHNLRNPIHILFFSIMMGFLATSVNVLAIFLWPGKCGYHYFAYISTSFQIFGYAIFLIIKAYILGQNIVSFKILNVFKYVMATLCFILFILNIVNIGFLWFPVIIDNDCFPVFLPWSILAAFVDGFINLLASFMFVYVISHSQVQRGDLVFVFQRRAIYAMLFTVFISLSTIILSVISPFPPMTLPLLIWRSILVNSFMVYSNNVGERDLHKTGRSRSNLSYVHQNKTSLPVLR